MATTSEILKAQEQLIKKGSWLNGYDPTTVRTADGITRAYVRIADTNQFEWLVLWMALPPLPLDDALVASTSICRWHWRKQK